MNKFKKLQTLAWIILLTSFVICLGLAIGVPLGARWLLLNVTRPLKIVVQPRDGVVSLQPAQNGPAILLNLGENTEVMADSTLKLTENAEAWLLFYHPDNATGDTTTAPIVTVQCYGDTEALVMDARTPRFALSRLPHKITLRIRRGANIQISIEGNTRDTLLRVETPHGTAEMGQGIYRVVVESEQTEFAVSSGQASVPNPATGEKFILTELQRAELTAAGLKEIYTGERDILRNRNGNFEQPLEGTWKIFGRTAFANEDSGAVRQTMLGDNRHIILLERVGQGFSETGVTQEINQDIRGIKSLRVRARLRVDAQTLSSCGSLGTECPVMIRIKFTDQSGAVREWLQGFYAIEGTDKPFCQSCEWQAVHIKVAQPGVWHSYESPNLLPLLHEKGIEPVSIQRVDIYASGHTYGAAVDEIAILVGE
ncbi:MAG TPA: hypothetical protein PLJ78_10525 [Anaerolineae bacterium]|nr:hypothetical protein [Anaerolineae bacterium]HQK14363.1 hypothetical protein [Anaerolineae bacterium]